MGFRKDSFAKCWEVEPKSDTITTVKLSTNRKNKDGEYEQDFNGFVSFIGTAVAKQAANLKEGARIKLGDVEVRNTYVKEKGVTYYNFNCYNFELIDDNKQNNSNSEQPTKNVDEGITDDSKLPF